MAGDWIAMRHDLAEDPTVLNLADALDVDVDTVVGRLHRLWCWADRQTVDGHAPGVTEVRLERVLHMPGFVTAVAAAGWIHADRGGLSFVNFDRWISESAKKRLQGARRQRRSRAERDGGVTEAQQGRNGSVTTGEERTGEERGAAAVGGVRPSETREVPNVNTQTRARARKVGDMDIEQERAEVREAWGRLRRLFGDSKHDPALVAEVLVWVRGWGARAESAVVDLIEWSKTREDALAAIFHAVSNGYADEKVRAKKPRAAAVEEPA